MHLKSIAKILISYLVTGVLSFPSPPTKFSSQDLEDAMMADFDDIERAAQAQYEKRLSSGSDNSVTLSVPLSQQLQPPLPMFAPIVSPTPWSTYSPGSVSHDYFTAFSESRLLSDYMTIFDFNKFIKKELFDKDPIWGAMGHAYSTIFDLIHSKSAFINDSTILYRNAQKLIKKEPLLSNLYRCFQGYLDRPYLMVDNDYFGKLRHEQNQWIHKFGFQFDMGYFGENKQLQDDPRINAQLHRKPTSPSYITSVVTLQFTPNPSPFAKTIVAPHERPGYPPDALIARPGNNILSLSLDPIQQNWYFSTNPKDRHSMRSKEETVRISFSTEYFPHRDETEILFWKWRMDINTGLPVAGEHPTLVLRAFHHGSLSMIKISNPAFVKPNDNFSKHYLISTAFGTAVVDKPMTNYGKLYSVTKEIITMMLRNAYEVGAGMKFKMFSGGAGNAPSNIFDLAKLVIPTFEQDIKILHGCLGIPRELL